MANNGTPDWGIWGQEPTLNQREKEESLLGIFTVFVGLGPLDLQLKFVDCLPHLLAQCPKSGKRRLPTYMLTRRVFRIENKFTM